MIWSFCIFIICVTRPLEYLQQHKLPPSEWRRKYLSYMSAKWKTIWFICCWRVLVVFFFFPIFWGAYYWCHSKWIESSAKNNTGEGKGTADLYGHIMLHIAIIILIRRLKNWNHNVFSSKWIRKCLVMHGERTIYITLKKKKKKETNIKQIAEN